MTAKNIGQSAVIHPGVVVHINGYKFCALLDSGASHLYASSTAIKLTCANLKSTGLRQIAMLTGVTTRTMQVALWSFVPLPVSSPVVSSPSRFVPFTFRPQHGRHPKIGRTNFGGILHHSALALV
jgi:hypothetical protein